MKKMKKRIFCTILSIMFFVSGINFSFAAEEGLKVNERYISFEAEDGVLSNEKLEVVTDKNASSGETVLYVGEGKGTREEYVRFQVELPRSGAYNVWVRIRHGYAGAAVFIRINEGSWLFTNKTEHVTETGGYWWCCMPKGPHTFNEGLNIIDVSHSNPVYFDKVVLTTSGTYTPSGITDPPASAYGFDYTGDLGSQSYTEYVETAHPRLLADDEAIARAKKYLEHPAHETFYNQFVEAVAKPVTGLEEDVNNSNSWRIHQNLEYNALYYLLFKDEEPEKAKSAALAAINGAINMLNTLKWTSDSVYVFESLNAASEVYDWCYDVMTDSQKDAIIRLGIMHMEGSIFGWPPLPEKGNAYSSGYATEEGIMRGYFAFAIAVYDEFPEAYYILSKRIFEEYIPTLNYFYEGSVLSQQGYNYGLRLRMRWELWLKWILERLGCGDLISKKQEEVAMQFAYGRRPDGLFMNDGDDGVADTGYYDYAPHTAFLAGNLYKNPMLRQEMFRADLNMNIFGPHYLLLDDPSIGLKGYESLPLSNWSGKLTGTMQARTSWDEGRVTSNAMIVNMKVQEKFFKGHQHLDAGEFEIYYKGALALDSGVYGTNYGSWFGSEHDYGYNKQTIAHNCMLIYNPENDDTYYAGYPSMGGQVPDKILHNGFDSLEFLKGEHTDYSTVLGYEYGDDMNKPEYTYLKGDLTKAYAGKADLYTRTFMFNNFFDDVYPGCLVVLDKVVTSKEGTEKTWLLHSQIKPYIFNGNVTRIMRTDSGYKARLYNETLLPENPEITIVGGTGKEFLVGEKNYSVSPANDESGKYRVEISPSAESGTDYFLNVMHVMESNNSAPRLIPELLETETHYGVKIKDRIMFLSKNEERISRELTFHITGDEEEYTVQVDSLKEGTWKISGENYEVAKEVTDNGGVINFKVKPGSYTLTYVNSSFNPKNYSMFAALDENAEDDFVQVKMKNSVGTGNMFEFCELDAFLKDGVIYAELEHYAKCTGSTVTYNEDGSYTLSHSGAVTEENDTGKYYITYETGKNKIKQRSKWTEYEKYLFSPPYEENGKIYIPITSTAKVISSTMEYRESWNLIRIIPTSGNPVAMFFDSDTDNSREYPTFLTADSFYFFGKLGKTYYPEIEYGVAVSEEKNMENAKLYPFTDKYTIDGKYGIQLKYSKEGAKELYAAFYKKCRGEYTFGEIRKIRKGGV